MAAPSKCLTDPVKVVSRLFDVLAGMYGAKFVDAWRGVDTEVMQRVWAKDLAAYSMKEVERGVNTCKALKWPPTLPEFLMLCRPLTDYEDAYHEALEQTRLRDSGRDNWTHPAIFWAAGRLGPDLQSIPYIALKTRWRRALDAALRDVTDGTVGAVPPAAVALTHERKVTPMPAGLRQKLAECVAHMTGKNTFTKEKIDAPTV